MVETVGAQPRYIVPRPRPRVTVGRTIEVSVGCGTLYVTINEDEHGIAEVFLRLGKSGGCSASQTEALGKMISLALRCDVNPEELIRRLKGIRCPNITWQDGEQITSCADAVAKTLEKYLRGDFHKAKAGADASTPLNEFFEVNGNGNRGESENKSEIEERRYAPHACPDCGSTMQPREGCLVCDGCGYSKCG
ncbi:TSCPD domain-containing protein [Archaeoglobus neptunius]|uniref:TSCPD domain-containing protein n=1 Tax=Archaeoglobus neptunius TaxID=2798580 RepID=UPI0019285048|nr:TSCPD domain-containing protein [Archaeoglobus neptunius]